MQKGYLYNFSFIISYTHKTKDPHDRKRKKIDRANGVFQRASRAYASD